MSHRHIQRTGKFLKRSIPSFPFSLIFFPRVLFFFLSPFLMVGLRIWISNHVPLGFIEGTRGLYMKPQTRY